MSTLTRVTSESREVTLVHFDLYTTTEGVLRMGIKRKCWNCGHRFALGDPVSIALTDHGNTPLCRRCAEAAGEGAH